MTSNTAPYDAKFFQFHSNGAQRSAEVVVPLIMQLVEPRSVVDVGSGDGTWLREFAHHGVSDYLGLDGDYVTRSLLKIPAERFRPMDLTRPQALGRGFDLAVSLELAEHLAERAAAGFVQFLTELAPIVLFSAAVPGQGGTSHVNEQWPWYWRDLFAGRGYVRLDPIRPLVWQRPDVDWWYRQNIVLYVRQAVLVDRPKLAEQYRLTPNKGLESLTIVSEEILRARVERPRSLRGLLKDVVEYMNIRAVSRFASHVSRLTRR